jgi:hypothetical protein
VVNGIRYCGVKRVSRDDGTGKDMLIDDGSSISLVCTKIGTFLVRVLTRPAHRAQKKKTGTLLVLHCWYLSNRMPPNHPYPTTPNNSQQHTTTHKNQSFYSSNRPRERTFNNARKSVGQTTQRADQAQRIVVHEALIASKEEHGNFVVKFKRDESLY